MSSTSSSRGILSRDFLSLPWAKKPPFCDMVRQKARELRHHNAILRDENEALKNHLHQESLVNHLHREEIQKLLSIAGETSERYLPLPHDIRQLVRDSLALANLPGNSEAIAYLDQLPTVIQPPREPSDVS